MYLSGISENSGGFSLTMTYQCSEECSSSYFRKLNDDYTNTWHSTGDLAALRKEPQGQRTHL